MHRRVVLFGVSALLVVVMVLLGIGVGGLSMVKEGPVQVEAAKAPVPAVRTVTVSDLDVSRLSGMSMFGGRSHFLPGNRVEVTCFGFNRTFDVGVGTGKYAGRGWISPVGPQLFRLLQTFSGGNLQYSPSDSRAYLMKLPMGLNARKLDPQVTKLPTLVNITTTNGRAIVMYLWP
ncbi:MAG: hypothetical protein A2Y91_02685 [Chloroflexi bacterium RBG_13_54_8]|nr:MAG: hypothetical protein A2Y91_02685 [Chloroflexi bacterium RBG_13_54_8]